MALISFRDSSRRGRKPADPWLARNPAGVRLAGVAEDGSCAARDLVSAKVPNKRAGVRMGAGRSRDCGGRRKPGFPRFNQRPRQALQHERRC
jgi:hypothetical protein